MDHKTEAPETRPAVSPAPDPPERKPYQPPELTSYGDLAAVTQGAGSKTADAGVGSFAG